MHMVVDYQDFDEFVSQTKKYFPKIKFEFTHNLDDGYEENKIFTASSKFFDIKYFSVDDCYYFGSLLDFFEIDIEDISSYEELYKEIIKVFLPVLEQLKLMFEKEETNSEEPKPQTWFSI